MVRVVSCLSALLYLVICLLAASGSGTGNGGKKRLGELFPSARVGRSDPAISTCCRDNAYFKRHQGLIPFPRVGRSGGWRNPDEDKLWQLLGPSSSVVLTSDGIRDWITGRNPEDPPQSPSNRKISSDLSDTAEDARGINEDSLQSPVNW